MTADQFKAQLRHQGKTLRQWADENGFQHDKVYRTFNGVYKGHYGEPHEILVRAGVKTPEPLAA